MPGIKPERGGQFCRLEGWVGTRPRRDTPQVDIVLRVIPVFHPNKALHFAKGVFLPEKILKCNFL